MIPTIRLFKALPVKGKKTKKASKTLLLETVRRGFVFSPEVIHDYSEQELLNLVKVIEKEIGLTPEQMNSSFQKSWKKVRDAPLIQLVVEQLIHYITTYGFKRLGIFNENTVYIPYAELDIPRLDESIKLVVIRGYTKDELRDKITSLLDTGIALAEDTKKDVINICVYTELSVDDIYTIKNRETRTALYDYFGFVPEDPVEFLRYLIFKTTEKTLLIKDKQTYEAIKTAASGKAEIVKTVRTFEHEHGLDRLAEIFYRFKPLFLAFRSNTNLRPIINKIRRLADIYHTPMEKDYLNEITAMIKRGKAIHVTTLKSRLEKASTFRKVRLAQALNYRNNKNIDSIVYKIRSGKAYAKEFEVGNRTQLKEVLDIVTNSIIEDVGKNVRGKKIFIPKYITYALPATEKQFVGNLPGGTYITIDRDMIFGIHWEDQNNNTIDIDLSLISADDTKIGWDASYRNRGRTALFSGDLTSAPLPNGASELFYISEADNTHYILFANYYNYNKDIPVPFKILVAQDRAHNFEENYMVDPNKVLCIAKSRLDVKQKMLGLIVTSLKDCRFYFNASELGKGITSSNKAYTRHARRYLFNYSIEAISLNEILMEAGAVLVDDKSEADIDLSPENLEKDTIISLLKGSKA